jgi:hypothetical protein
MLLLVVCAHLSATWLLWRGVAVTVQFLESLIAFVCSTLDLWRSGDPTPLEQFAIVLSALANGDTDELAGLLRDDEWGFLGGAFFLPAVGAPLFLCGRSTGLSAPSTTITSNGVPPAGQCFLPGKGQTLLWMSRFSIRCTVRHTTDAATPHARPIWQEVRYSRQDCSVKKSWCSSERLVGRPGWSFRCPGSRRTGSIGSKV